MKKIILFLSAGFACGLFFVNVYTSLIDARSWGSDIPNSITAARDYFKAVNPGDFFRIFSPINQVLGLLTLILFWKSSPSIRLWLGIAAVLYIATDVLTFAYFYPRNDIMFKTAALSDIALLKKTWSEWNTMNWARSLILIAGISLTFASLHRIYLVSKK